MIDDVLDHANSPAHEGAGFTLRVAIRSQRLPLEGQVVADMPHALALRPVPCAHGTPDTWVDKAFISRAWIIW